MAAAVTSPVTSAEVVATEQGRTLPVVSGKLSWGALFGALFVTLGIFALLMSIGLAVGLAAINPNNPASAKGAGIGIGVWSAICSIVALFIGGVLASRTAGIVDRTVGAVHGAVVWGLGTVLTIFLIVSAVRTVGSGVVNLGAAIISAGGAGAQAAATGGDELAQALGVSSDDLTAAVNQRLQREGKPPVSSNQIQAVVSDVARTTVVEGRFDRELIVSSIAENTNLSREAATDLVDRMEDAWNRHTSALASSASKTMLGAAKDVGHAMWWVFLGLLVGLASAVGGAVVGVRPKQRLAAEGKVPAAPGGEPMSPPTGEPFLPSTT
jgi:hypothetical protein